MKKIITLFLCFVVALVMLTACGQKLPEGLTEEMVKAAGETAIKQLSDNDFASFAENLSDEMHEALGKDKDEEDALADIWSQLELQAGEYDSISKSAVKSQNEYAVYSASLKFSKSNITTTISFDKDLKTAGIFFK